jgi:predicted dehydrogenase
MNVGLIGYGYWGPNVAKNIFKNKKTFLHTICDLKIDRLNLAKDIYIDQCRYQKDYQNLLGNPEIEGIAIVTPTSTHFQIAKDALNAGKHLFIEKPITSSSDEAEELKAIAAKNGLIIHVDHIMIYHPCIQKIHELLSSGSLGEILYIEAMRMNLGQIKTDVSAMADLAVHDLSIIDYLCNGQEPQHITAIGDKKYSPKESLTFLTLRYQNFIAHISSSWISPVKERRLIVAGTRKMAVFDDMRPATEKLFIYDKGIDAPFTPDIEYADYAAKTRNGDILIPHILEGDALFNSIDHFVDSVKSGKPSLSGPEQAMRVIRILDRAEKVMS